MIGLLDRWIEKILKRALHGKRQKIIDKTIAAFKLKHPEVESLTELLKRLNTEADRVYAMVDRSILRERIKRAKYTFWATAIAASLLVGVLGGFSSGAALPFITPPATALITWLVSLATIPVSYNQRVKGGMDSAVALYENDLVARAAQLNEKKIQELLPELKEASENVLSALASVVPIKSTSLAEFTFLKPATEVKSTPAQMAVDDEKESHAVRWHYS